MNDWWLRFLGVDARRIPEDADYYFTLTNAPRSWHVFVLLAVAATLLYGVFYLYRREVDVCPRRAKLSLAALRAATIVLLVFVFMGPALGISKQRTVRPQVILLLDTSMSMSIHDQYDDDTATLLARLDLAPTDKPPPNRAKLVDKLLRRDHGHLVNALRQRGQLRLFTFSNKLTEHTPIPPIESSKTPPNERSDDMIMVAMDRNDWLPPLEPSGPGTDFNKAIGGILHVLSGKPIAGIVLISDGQHNQGDDPLEAADDAAIHDVPIFAVGIGNPHSPRNVKVASVWGPKTVFRNDPLAIRAEIRSNGHDAGTIEVQLLEQRADVASADETSATVIARQSVSIAMESGPIQVQFVHTPQTDGRFVYTVEVPAVPGELIKSDNVECTLVNVVSDKVKVLLIAGTASWEYRMVRGLLLREKTIDLSCWLQSRDADISQEGNTVIDRIPDTAETLFHYDVLLLFDPDPIPRQSPAAFSAPFIDLTKRFLDEHAGGLLYMAGPKHATAFLSDARTRRLNDVLPVQYRNENLTEIELLTRQYSRAWPFRLTTDGFDHSLLRFSTDRVTNQLIWERIPGIYWSLPIEHAMPTTQVLLEHTDPTLDTVYGARPLLVTGRYGSGRTIYMGFDTTWRWRRVGRNSEVFDAFWIQLVRYLVEGRALGGQRRGRIVLDRENYHIGSRILIAAELFDDTYQPLTSPTIPTVLQQNGRDVDITLTAIPNRPGHYQASHITTHLGLHKLSILLPGENSGGAGQRITRQFTVEIPRVEFEDPRLNHKLLNDMANRSGGRYFSFDQLDQLPAAIPDRQQSITIPAKPAPIWDTNRLLLCLVTLLSLEWSMRKFFKLI